MKIRGLLCIVLLGCSWQAFPEAALTVGASAESTRIDPVSAGIEPFLKGACSLTAPLSDRASALADAAFRLGYGWPGQGLTWFGFAAADFSWRAGPLFAMLGASATAEGDATGSLPSFEAATDVEVSLDLSHLTLSFIPAVRVRAGDEQGLGVDGVLSSILAAGDAAVARIRIQGGLEWPVDGLPEWIAGAGLGVSWYPGMPLVASIDAAALRRVSSNSSVETIDGVPITVPNADSYMELSVLPEISAQLGRSLTLGLSAPIALRLMDHGAVVAGVLIAEPEWLLTCGPMVSLRLEASPSVSLKATLGGDLAFSNSSFREKRVAYLTLEAVLSPAPPH